MIEKRVPFNKVASAQTVDKNNVDLKKNADKAKDFEAIPKMCVQNTQRILAKTGTGKIEAPRLANHTLSALQDLQKGGWTELKDSDPSKAPLGSVVASFKPTASEGTPFGSDLGVLTEDENRKRRIGGGKGAGAYAVKMDKPNESVYAGAKTRIFVPPTAAKTA